MFAALNLVALSLIRPLGTRQDALGPVIAKGAKLEVLGTGFSFTEGPAADKEGNVYFTDQPNDRIMLWHTNGKIEVWLSPSGRSNGMWFDRSGNLIACADENNQLWSISKDKKIAVLVRDYQGSLLNGPNDVWIRPNGGMYVTDPLYVRSYWKRDPKSQLDAQHVFYLTPDRKSFRPVAFSFGTPNGIIGTPDGKTLYIGDLGRSETYRFKIEKDGRLTGGTPFFPLGSDGMTMDERGDIYISGNGVTVVDKNGGQIAHIDVPEPWVGHVAFGGADHKLLFITAGDKVFGLKMTVRGAF
jgi:gluconolactonase